MAGQWDVRTQGKRKAEMSQMLGGAACLYLSSANFSTVDLICSKVVVLSKWKAASCFGEFLFWSSDFWLISV